MLPDDQPTDDEIALWKADTLHRHLKLGRAKPLSYLPIRAIEKHLALSVPEYLAMIESSGHCGIAIGSDRCWLDSGAVFAFSKADLEEVLQSNRDVLVRCGWPLAPEAFVRRVAAEWIEEGDVLGVIRQAFGDAESP